MYTDTINIYDSESHKIYLKNNKTDNTADIHTIIATKDGAEKVFAVQILLLLTDKPKKKHRSFSFCLEKNEISKKHAPKDFIKHIPQEKVICDWTKKKLVLH